MNIKTILLAIIYLTSLIQGSSQDKISGIVIDTTGMPLPGVNISIIGTIKGTISDLDGNFIIECIHKTDKLLFEYIGYITQEIDLSTIDIKNLEIVLKPIKRIRYNENSFFKHAFRFGPIFSSPNFHFGGFYSHNIETIGKKSFSLYWNFSYQQSITNDKKIEYKISKIQLFTIKGLTTGIGISGKHFLIDTVKHHCNRIFLNNDINWKTELKIGLDRIGRLKSEPDFYGYYFGIGRNFNNGFPASRFGDILMDLSNITFRIFENCYIYGDFIYYNKYWFYKIGYSKFFYWIEKPNTFLIEPIILNLSYEKLYDLNIFMISIIFNFFDNREIYIR